MLFRRTNLSDRQEAAVHKTLQNLRSQRRNRFRTLACIDGTEESLVTVRFVIAIFVDSYAGAQRRHIFPAQSRLQPLTCFANP